MLDILVLVGGFFFHDDNLKKMDRKKNGWPTKSLFCRHNENNLHDFERNRFSFAIGRDMCPT